MRVYLRKAVENGAVIFPTKFVLSTSDKKEGEKKESIEQLKADLIPSEFAALYLNDPVDSDAIEFKPAWFQITTILEPWQKSKCIISIDPAFRLKQTNDFTGITVSRINQDGNIVVLLAEQKKLNANDLVNRIFDLVKIYKPDKVILETVAAQIVLLTLIRQKMQQTGEWFLIEEVKLDTSETKAMRIRALIPLYANMKIFHLPGLKDVENQLIEFPRGLHDDIIDSLAHCVKFWKKPQLIVSKDSAPYWSVEWFKKMAKLTKSDDKLFSDFRTRGY